VVSAGRVDRTDPQPTRAYRGAGPGPDNYHRAEDDDYDDDSTVFDDDGCYDDRADLIDRAADEHDHSSGDHGNAVDLGRGCRERNLSSDAAADRR